MMESSCCSAPGKVLVTGGYLVLDRLYEGLVLTINSRFYTVIKQLQQQQDENNSSNRCVISLISPQFSSKQKYQLTYHNLGQQDQRIELVPHPTLQDISLFKENKYVERTLIYSFIALSALVAPSDFTKALSQGIEITIIGDNDFYSQIPQLKAMGLPITYESLKQVPAFSPLRCTLDDIQKTGLGSSAALVSSLTAAILTYFKAIKLDTNREDKDLLHNLAQLCHCVAQGKIGSGFDISSAVYGSQVYRRFSPSLIQPILDLFDSNKYPDSKTLLQSILPKEFNTSYKLGNYQKWDNENTRMALPPKLELLLADVSIGSNTPVMVRKVLEWRKSNPIESLKLWSELDTFNNKVKLSFNRLHDLYAKDKQSYERVINHYATLSQLKWSDDEMSNQEVAQELINIRLTIIHIRSLMRRMGELADVPLEPKEQTELADSTMNVLGCVAAGVPGAGGFDALFAITLSSSSSSAIKQSWSNWSTCQVLPLVLNEDPTGVIVDRIPSPSL